MSLPFHDECMTDLSLDVRPDQNVLFITKDPISDGILSTLLHDPKRVYGVPLDRKRLESLQHTFVCETFPDLWEKYANVQRPMSLLFYVTRFLYIKPTMSKQKHSWYHYEYLSKFIIWIMSKRRLLKAYGISDRQLNMIIDDKRTIFEYIWTILDGVFKNTLLANNICYVALFHGRYSRELCPLPLQENHFDTLKHRIHKLRIKESVFEIQDKVHRVMLLDQLDLLEPQEVISVIIKLRQIMTIDSLGLFRSVSLKPWYVDEFERQQFDVQRNASHNDALVDFANVYASFWTFKPIKECKLE